MRCTPSTVIAQKLLRLNIYLGCRFLEGCRALHLTAHASKALSTIRVLLISHASLWTLRFASQATDDDSRALMRRRKSSGNFRSSRVGEEAHFNQELILPPKKSFSSVSSLKSQSGRQSSQSTQSKVPTTELCRPSLMDDASPHLVSSNA